MPADDRTRPDDEEIQDRADEGIEMPEGREPRILFQLVAAIYATAWGLRALGLASGKDTEQVTAWGLAVFIGALAGLFAIALVIRVRWAITVGILMTSMAVTTSTIYLLRGQGDAAIGLVWSALLLLWMIEPLARRALEGGTGELVLPWWAAIQGNRLGRNFGLEVKIVVSAMLGFLAIVVVFAVATIHR